VTLGDILKKVARKTNRVDDYAGGTESDIKTIFTDGVNRAVRQIVEDKYPIDYGQSVTLDANACFTTVSPTLTKEFRKIKRIQVSATDTTEYDYELLTQGTIHVYASPSTAVYVIYYYAPADLLALASDCEIPDGVINPDVIADGAVAYYWETQERFDKANWWDAKFNRSLDEVFAHTVPRRIRVRRMY
jgi:hypothetical protein